MFDIVIDHLPLEEELAVVSRTTAVQDLRFEAVVSAADIVAFQQLVRRVPVADEVIRYAVGLARATRPKEPGAPDFIKQFVEYGASVRAAQYLVLGGKARALMAAVITWASTTCARCSTRCSGTACCATFTPNPSA
jgi:MoxR-like ATPase